jgi:hypothetical protein
VKTTRVKRRSNIEAVQITQENMAEVAQWSGGDLCTVFLGCEADRIRLYESTARVGDYVIHEDGKFISVTPDVYAVLYQPEGE